MSVTRATWLRHVCYTNDTRATRVKNLDFDNDTSGNIFSHQFISYIANERLQGEGNFILRMCSKSELQKLNFAMAKSCIKYLYTILQLQMPLHAPA